MDAFIPFVVFKVSLTIILVNAIVKKNMKTKNNTLQNTSNKTYLSQNCIAHVSIIPIGDDLTIKIR